MDEKLNDSSCESTSFPFSHFLKFVKWKRRSEKKSNHYTNHCNFFVTLIRCTILCLIAGRDNQNTDFLSLERVIKTLLHFLSEITLELTNFPSVSFKL